MVNFNRIEASLRLQMHELSDAVGFSDGWCVHDTLSEPEHHYPQEQGKWGAVTNRPSMIAAAVPLGLPISAPIAYSDGRRYLFELFNQGRVELYEPLNQQELTLLHEVARSESANLHAGEYLDFKSLIERVREIAGKIDK